MEEAKEPDGEDDKEENGKEEVNETEEAEGGGEEEDAENNDDDEKREEDDEDKGDEGEDDREEEIGADGEGEDDGGSPVAPVAEEVQIVAVLDCEYNCGYRGTQDELVLHEQTCSAKQPSTVPQYAYRDPEEAWKHDTCVGVCCASCCCCILAAADGQHHRVKDVAEHVQREINFLRSIPRRTKAALLQCTWTNFKALIKRKIDQFFGHIGKVMNYYTSVETVTYVMSHWMWDACWLLLFSVWCFTIPTFFDEKVSPGHYLAEKGTPFKPIMIDAASAGYTKVLRNSTALASDIFETVPIPPSTHKLAFVSVLLSACAWLPAVTASLIQREADAHDWDILLVQNKHKGTFGMMFGMSLLAMEAYDPIARSHIQMTQPTILRAPKKYCRQIFHLHKWMLFIVGIVLAAGAEVIYIFITYGSDMEYIGHAALTTVLFMLGLGAWICLPLLHAECTPFDLLQRKKGMGMAKVKKVPFEKEEFDRTKKLPWWLPKRGLDVPYKQTFRVYTSCVMFVITGVPLFVFMNVTAAGSPATLAPMVLFLAATASILANLWSFMPFLHMPWVLEHERPLHLHYRRKWSIRGVNCQTYFYYVWQAAPFILWLFFTLMAMVKSSEASPPMVMESRSATYNPYSLNATRNALELRQQPLFTISKRSYAPGSASLTSIMHLGIATLTFAQFNFMLYQPFMGACCACAFIPFCVFLDMLGKKQDGVLVADYKMVFIPLEVAVVILVIVLVFIKPMTRTKKRKWENYMLDVRVGADGATQGKVLDVYKLKKATRNRWKRAAIKTILTNKLKMGFAAGGKAAKVVPGGAASALMAGMKSAKAGALSGTERGGEGAGQDGSNLGVLAIMGTLKTIDSGNRAQGRRGSKLNPITVKPKKQESELLPDGRRRDLNVKTHKDAQGRRMSQAPTYFGGRDKELDKVHGEFADESRKAAAQKEQDIDDAVTLKLDDNKEGEIRAKQLADRSAKLVDRDKKTEEAFVRRQRERMDGTQRKEMTTEQLASARAVKARVVEARRGSIDSRLID
jgi:hypothetical protein